jgi:hypothetical protein
MPPAQTIEILQDPDPLGSVTLAPAGMTGRSEADLARSLAESALETARHSQSEMSLGDRVAALTSFGRR